MGELNFGPDDSHLDGPKQALFLSFHVREVVAPLSLKVGQKQQKSAATSD
jgi:hypothetical protein